MVLRQRLPEAQIDVLSPSHTAPLLTRMPEVDDTHIMDIKHGTLDLASRRRVARDLKTRQYDQAIVLQRSAKAALVPWLAGIRQRTGQRGEPRFGLINDARRLDKSRYPLKAEHYALLGLPRDGDPLPPIRYPRLRMDADNQNILIEKLALDIHRPIAGFAPGAAFGTAKQWPARHYASLARALDERGWACWVFGGKGDHELAAQICAAAPRHSVDLTGRTQLVDVVDLAALSTQFVGNDTGITHIAAAAADSVIGLYGSTDPDYAPPLSPVSQRLWRGMDCSPCRKRECPLSHHACLEDMLVSDVLTACLEPGSDKISALHTIKRTASQDSNARQPTVHS